MSGIFDMDLERHEKAFLQNKKAKAVKNEEPIVPNRALVLVQFGVPRLLYHQGTGLNYWTETLGEKEAAEEMMGTDHADGMFVWSGNIQGAWTDNCNGKDYDEWLEATDIRPATKEEWQAFSDDEIVWDFDEMSTWLNWKFQQDKLFEED